MNTQQKATIVLKELKKLYPKPKLALKSSNNWELFVSVVLSAQCTDKKVNEVTRELFKKYKKLDDYAKADVQKFETDVKPTGFYKNKAKNILAAAKIVKKEFNGKIPKTMNEMLTIPGVGRKTANVILGIAYKKAEGIAVDTHVMRLSKLFGLTSQKTPDKIEKDLMKIIPKKEWINFTLRMIQYGRDYCPAKKHKHSDCPITKALK